MFRSYNVALTNARADLCHAHGRIYMHHSCGLLHDLLPVYRETRMDGVDAFTPPPIGDVTFTQGRRLMGTGFSMISSLSGGLASVMEGDIPGLVAERLEDARAAGSVALTVGGSHLTFQAMESIMLQARQLRRME